MTADDIKDDIDVGTVDLTAVDINDDADVGTVEFTADVTNEEADETDVEIVVVKFSRRSFSASLLIMHVSLWFQSLSHVDQGRGLKKECMK